MFLVQDELMRLQAKQTQHLLKRQPGSLWSIDSGTDTSQVNAIKTWQWMERHLMFLL